MRAPSAITSRPVGWSDRVTLACPVAGCRRPLTRQGPGVRCARGHAFDLARSGYVNLLQPQDRRSARPGDSSAALAARRRLHARGVEEPVAAAITRLAMPASGDAVLDVGCGEGHLLAAIAGTAGAEGHGLDLSVAAIDAAARRYPTHYWVVANADRVLPYADGSFSLLMSINARRNPTEFRRVLRGDGTLLLVVPAPDDLIEVRERVLGEAVERDRAERAIAEFTPLFTLERRERIRHTARLDAAALQDAMAGSYRAGRTSRLARLASIAELDVTLSRDALLFRPARAHGSARRAEAPASGGRHERQ
ncbi:MAG TPA: methyltransferase domain-containing protein [Methylomirabilota bacterium]|nr:methyltransferase domain-containing protein [Methylomirabilota bacterium]